MDKEKLIRFIITDWIAEKKSIPTRFSSKIIKQSDKAYQVKILNKTIWIPKSQIISIREIE